MNSELSPDRLLTRREAEEVFGISVRYLEVAGSRGDARPAIRIGRMIRYRVADVRAWIEAHRVESTS